jgi:competence protein ComEC
LTTTIHAECCFADVGQGTCNIILLGANRAIVIDCGRRGITPVRLLRHFRVRELVALIVSHNDNDHCGGALDIIVAYPRAIRQVLFLEDRPARENRFYGVIKSEVECGNIPQPQRLEASSPSGSCLWQEPERSLSLHVLFPWFGANIAANEAGGRNETSALMALNCGRRRVVFPGDLQLSGWRALRQQQGAPVRCNVLAAPHHCGDLARGQEVSGVHTWIYTQAVRCDTAIVSVGSSNPHGHPAPEHLRAILQTGASVLCTQITPRCHEDLEAVRAAILARALPGSSSNQKRTATASGRSRDVGCAGTVMVEIGPETVNVQRLPEHRAAMMELVTTPGWHPLCRSA